LNSSCSNNLLKKKRIFWASKFQKNEEKISNSKKYFPAVSFSLFWVFSWKAKFYSFPSNFFFSADSFPPKSLHEKKFLAPFLQTYETKREKIKLQNQFFFRSFWQNLQSKKKIPSEFRYAIGEKNLIWS